MSGVVCAVCYEDVKPGCEDLQAVAGCGHVFHELCLQQWLEYCHRKPSCPVCKQHCSKTDVHRLYFLSSGELTQKTQTQSASSHGAVNLALEAQLQKLEAQVSVANFGLQTSKQQLQELENQLANHKLRLEKAESSRRDAIGEREHYKGALCKVQEDLNKCLGERSKLLDKNTSLAKELASMKLVADLNIDESEILRLATVGHGRNKEDIIDTLTRSLVLRNKSYRDLVNKYSTLGVSEKTAHEKAGKASEQLRRLKMRMQDLERVFELKENKELRSLKQRNEQIDLTGCETFQVARAKAMVDPGVKKLQPNLTKFVEEGPSSFNLEQDNQIEVGCSFTKALAASSSLLHIPIRREVSSPDDQTDNQTTRKRVYATSLPAQAGARGFQHIKSSNDKGSFILTGADGRGGRVTVLKPPQHLGIRTSAITAPSRQVKRCKQTSAKGNIKNNENGVLSIDHFFDRAE